MTDLGAQIIDLAARAQSDFVMCAPFVKAAIASEVISAVSSDVQINLYTRWRPDEVAAGISDTAVLPLVEARGGHVYLHDRLHAKLYRNEVDVLVGSANLTATALGWTPSPNVELLVRVEKAVVAELEEQLRRESVLATPAMAHEVEHIAELLPVRPITIHPNKPPLDLAEWIPSLRIPSDLFIAYTEGPSKLTSRSAAAAERDLAVLDLPIGLNVEQFYRLVAHRLQQQLVFRRIDEYLNVPRRFGEARDKLAEISGLSRDDADDAWQTMMRWMLEYLPEKYRRQVFKTSEVMSIVNPIAPVS